MSVHLYVNMYVFAQDTKMGTTFFSFLAETELAAPSSNLCREHCHLYVLTHPLSKSLTRVQRLGVIGHNLSRWALKLVRPLATFHISLLLFFHSSVCVCVCSPADPYTFFFQQNNLSLLLPQCYLAHEAIVHSLTGCHSKLCTAYCILTGYHGKLCTVHILIPERTTTTYKTKIKSRRDKR